MSACLNGPDIRESVVSCVVLAGGAADAVTAHDPSLPNKAFVTVDGLPLVTRVIDVLRTSPSIGRIIVVAPERAHAHPALADADERRSDGRRITESLRSGLRDLEPNALVIIAASDLPILTREAVDEFIASAQRTEADIVYSCVERRTHLSRFPSIPHTWAHFRTGTYCGGGLAALRPRVLPKLECFLERLGAARKNPAALASIFGWNVLARYVTRRLTITQAEQRARELLGATARAVICSHPEVAVNIDRARDISSVERLLAHER